MGAHHFALDFIPIGVRPVRDEEGQYEGAFLIGHEIPVAVAMKLRGLLPKPNHWGNCEEFISAHAWGSDIRILMDNGRIVEIGFRYSPGCDPIQLLEAVVALAKEVRCDLLINSTHEIMTADFEVVFAALRKHRAFRFLSDPKGAIKEAADETKG